MNYIVIELQTNAGTTANITNQYDNLPQAEQQFYTVCSAAVVSSVEVHAVLIVDDHGFLIKNECFTHVQSEPEPEPEE